ncbi:MAG: hypothetical protein PHT75_00560 [Bacilli bacterium]|nr:hypothetical protein [Bacilli bacterium]MDD4053749.1 hypothetical protein [Bacilli bacterium]
MNENNILDMFFKNVLPSIAEGELKVEDATYNIRFNTAVLVDGKYKNMTDYYNPELPTMTIKNIEQFSSYLLEFINEITNRNMKWCTPYIDVSTKEAEIKYFLSIIWCNMTANDFQDPQYYLKRYISFLRDETFKNLNITCGPVEKLNNNYLTVSNIEEAACYETPYALRIAIVDQTGNESFTLPDIKYAIEENNGIKKAYIYAIQYDRKSKISNDNNKKFQSKINRALYKVNQDIPKEELDKKMKTQEATGTIKENIIDVTPSALLSLTVALSLFTKAGIRDILVPGYLPLRWDAKKVMYERKLNYYKNLGLDQSKIVDKEEEFKEEQFRIQRNITDKLLRNFERIQFHFRGLDTLFYPLERDDFMHLNLDNNFNAYNNEHLLSQISELIVNNEISPKRK